MGCLFLGGLKLKGLDKQGRRERERRGGGGTRLNWYGV